MGMPCPSADRRGSILEVSTVMIPMAMVRATITLMITLTISGGLRPLGPKR